MPDYWPSSGYRLLTVGADGRLTLTDDFLRVFLARPELAPVRESCAGELALHDALLANPRRATLRAVLRGVAAAHRDATRARAAPSRATISNRC